MIGLDHFALAPDALYHVLVNGTLHRNFMRYSTHPAEESVAFGMSAISDLGGAFYQNDHTTREYEADVGAGRLPVMRGVDRSPENDLRHLAMVCDEHLRKERECTGPRFSQTV